MKPMTSEWVDKTEGDLITARRELLAPTSPNYDAAAFHAQQCAEKYLKAQLIEAGVSFPKTHDLGAIPNLPLPLETDWDALRSELNALTALAVEVRYPGTSADLQTGARAVDIAQKVRDTVRASLGI